MDYSDELLKQVQEKSLEFMIGIDRYFQENDIDYMLCAGSALGAVRHGGFIPWDDDVDFDMHIDEMRKLAKVCKNDKEFNKKYFLQNKWTDKNVPEQFWRIRMNGTTMMDKEGLSIPMHWGLPIDIFPVYNAPNNKFLRKVMVRLNGLMCKYSRIPLYNPNASLLKKMAAAFMYKLEFYVLLIISNGSKKTDYLYYPTGHGSVDNRFIKRSVYFPTKRIDFENYSFKCHNDIKEYLHITYGDYMTLPPEEQRVSHGCFKVDMENDYTKYVNYKKLKG